MNVAESGGRCAALEKDQRAKLLANIGTAIHEVKEFAKVKGMIPTASVGPFNTQLEKTRAALMAAGERTQSKEDFNAFTLVTTLLYKVANFAKKGSRNSEWDTTDQEMQLATVDLLIDHLSELDRSHQSQARALSAFHGIVHKYNKCLERADRARK